MPEPMTGVLRPDIELISGPPALLFDPISDAYFKVSPETLKIISFLTQSMPVSNFCKLLGHQGIAITLPQLAQILNFLQQNNLLRPEYGVIGLKRFKQAEIRKKTFFLRFSAAYLFFRLPPIRPDRVFSKISPYVSWLASKKVIFALLIPAALGYLLLLRNFNLVAQTFWNSLSWSGLVKYFFAIILMKIIHEGAHSIASMHFNCRVRGIGLGFMVFYPRLYTDTTDSWRLPRKQRSLIDGAGIIAELLCGGIAALLWSYLPPGTWKSTMFYIFSVSTISTLLVNGNPCIRYDGYYILCDICNIENLMTRSSDYVKRFWRWSCLHMGERPKDNRGTFLLVFGICSAIYRIFLYTSIILVIYHKFTKAIAIVMMLLELFSILIYPAWREIQVIHSISKDVSSRVRWIMVFLFITAISVVLFWPISWDIDVLGEIAPARQTIITIVEGGYINASLSRSPRKVMASDLLFGLESPQLDFAMKQMDARIEYNKKLLNIQRLDEKTFAESLATEQKLKSDLLGREELKRRKKKLAMRAPQGGFFLLTPDNLSRGAYLPRGYKIGEVVSPRPVVYAYCEDYHVGDIKCGADAIITLPGTLKRAYGHVVEISSVAVPLKNSVLLQSRGGAIPVVQERNSIGEYCSERLYYRIVLQLSDASGLDIGRSVYVTITKREQLYKRIIKFLLSAFRKEF